MDFAKTISEVIENNYFNELADFDKKIERRERLIQVFFVILSLLVSYNGVSVLHGNLIRLYLFFVFFALLYYVALPVSIDKMLNTLKKAEKKLNKTESSLKKARDILFSVDKIIAENEETLKNSDEQFNNLEDSLSSLNIKKADLEINLGKPNVDFDLFKTFDLLESGKLNFGETTDLLRSAKLYLDGANDSLQSEVIYVRTEIDQARIRLNVNRFFLFLLGSLVACIFSFFLFYCSIGIIDGYVHPFPWYDFIGYIFVAILVSKALYI